MPNIPNVIDNLYSTSDTDALSANQGKILKELINAVPIGLSKISSGLSYSGYIGPCQIFVSSGTREFTMSASIIHTLNLIVGSMPTAATLNILESSNNPTYPASCMLFTTERRGVGILVETSMVTIFQVDSIDNLRVSAPNYYYALYG